MPNRLPPVAEYMKALAASVPPDETQPDDETPNKVVADAWLGKTVANKTDAETRHALRAWASNKSAADESKRLGLESSGFQEGHKVRYNTPDGAEHYGQVENADASNLSANIREYNLSDDDSTPHGRTMTVHNVGWSTVKEVYHDDNFPSTLERTTAFNRFVAAWLKDGRR